MHAVGPGFIETGLENVFPPELRAKPADAHPLGRMGKAHDVAEPVVRRAGPKAGFATGVCCPVDGGTLAR